jgi:hypothetical protein
MTDTGNNNVMTLLKDWKKTQNLKEKIMQDIWNEEDPAKK